MKRGFLFILTSIYILFPNNTFSTDINIASVTAKDGLYLRKCPSINCKIVTLIPYKENVNIIQFSSDKNTIEGITAPWAEVKYTSHRGWVFGGFLSSHSTENNYFKYVIIAIALLIITGLSIIFRKYYVFIFAKFKPVDKKNQKIPEEVPPSEIESINLEQQSLANLHVINKPEINKIEETTVKSEEIPVYATVNGIIGLIIAIAGFIIPVFGVLYITPIAIIIGAVTLYGGSKPFGIAILIINAVNLIVSPIFWANIGAGNTFAGASGNRFLTYFDIIGMVVMIILTVRLLSKRKFN